MTEIEITDIAEYLQKIKEHKLDLCISRGEPTFYNDTAISSSAFRPYIDTTSNTYRTRCYGIQELKDFYNLIGNELTPMQKQHFLAFAQHHGLPTNLIDFSYSPLISLFFACCDNDDTKDGYVYFINKCHLVASNDDYIDIINNLANKNSVAVIDKMQADFSKDRIRGHALNSDITQDDVIVEKVLNNFKKFIQQIPCLQQIIEAENPSQDKYWWHLIRNINKKIINFIDVNKAWFNAFYFPNEVLEYIKNTCQHSGEEISNMLNNKKSYKPLLDIKLYSILINSSSLNAINVFCILYFKLTTCSSEFEIIQEETIDFTSFFYLPFYLTYSPPNIAHRINLQNSVFIYQTSIKNNYFPLSNSNSILVQKIKSDFIIKINKNNKQQILNELNQLNVNHMSIFGDYDNIAKHIKQNFKNQSSD